MQFSGLFIIDPHGILRQITINDLPVGRSVDETLRLIKVSLILMSWLATITAIFFCRLFSSWTSTVRYVLPIGCPVIRPSSRLQMAAAPTSKASSSIFIGGAISFILTLTQIQ
jgi:hypothetical protein